MLTKALLDSLVSLDVDAAEATVKAAGFSSMHITKDVITAAVAYPGKIFLEIEDGKVTDAFPGDFCELVG